MWLRAHFPRREEKKKVIFIAMLMVMCCCINLAYSEDSQSRHVVLNNHALTEQELEYYDKLFCGIIPDGRYWLKEDTLEWGGEGFPSRGYFDANCFEKGKPHQPVKRIIVNGQALNRRQVYFLESIACGPIPPGYYWLDPETGLWGRPGEKHPRGHIQDNCQEKNRSSYLSEKGSAIWSDSFYIGGCPSPPCHD